MGYIDLHIHSTASDGTMRPSSIVGLAASRGLTAIALTDHDTVSGLPEAMEASARFGVEVIGGCELSSELDGHSLHLLGLFLPASPSGLTRTIADLLAKREARNREMIERLNMLGIDISLEEVVRLAGGEAVGRPHIAQILVQKRAASSLQKAFDLYLGARGKAYVPKRKLSPKEAIEALHGEGALAVLAHPYLLGLPILRLEELMVSLRDLGLDGIEAYYTEHSRQQTEAYLGIARRLGLAVSGGSDFHGLVKPDIEIGKGKGRLVVPYEVLDALRAYRDARGLGA